MQQIIFYLKMNGVNGVLVDEFNQALSTSMTPMFTRGMKCELVLNLFTENDEPYPAEQFESLVSWDFVLANDWLTATAPQIRVRSGIRAEGHTCPNNFPPWRNLLIAPPHFHLFHTNSQK